MATHRLFHARSMTQPIATLPLAAILVAALLANIAPTFAQPSPEEVVRLYGQAWNETDPQKRSELLEKAWADDGVYADPTAVVEGRAALIEHIGGFQRTMRGATLELTSAVDVHHDQHLRFSWRITAPARSPGDTRGVIAEGLDYGELGPDGRLVRIIGFFGPLPPLETE